jgi:hypothetical protein
VTAGKLVMAAIASHSPRIGVEATAPDFLRGVIRGEYALGRAIQALEPDVIVFAISALGDDVHLVRDVSGPTSRKLRVGRTARSDPRRAL